MCPAPGLMPALKPRESGPIPAPKKYRTTYVDSAHVQCTLSPRRSPEIGALFHKSSITLCSFALGWAGRVAPRHQGLTVIKNTDSRCRC